MTKHWLPLTYEPKIEAVFDGSCTQSIRLGSKYSVGDYVGYHLWEGLPYRSKWGRRTKLMEIEEIIYINVAEEGFTLESIALSHWITPPVKLDDAMVLWESSIADNIARRDFINPPTGIALRDVLKSFHGELKGQPMQIIRWNPEKVKE